MTDDVDPEADWILYEKDPATKIATLTLNRPDRLNAPTIGMRLRYADLLHQANIDDDVKVLVIRGAGDDFGTGQDLPEFMEAVRSEDGLLREVGLEDVDVTYPPKRNFRHGATTTQWFTDPRGGCRTLQEFKKISIVEAKGYVYGWHFYQAGDADLVISSDDALFGHAAFRYAGAAPRMWWWAMSMGIRKFQEMVFTGRPFTAAEMAELGFVNSVVPRDRLEDEVQKYARACAQNRPTDVIFMQKTFFEVMKQFQGEYMGSLLSGVLESMAGYGRPDADALGTDDAIDQGLSKAVKDFDSRFPPEWRLSKQGRAGSRMTSPLADYVVLDLSTGIAGAYCTKLLADGGAEVIKVEPPEGDPLRRWSASGTAISDGDDGALFAFLASSKQSVVADPDDDADVERVQALLARADAVVWSRGSRLAELPALSPGALRVAAPHLTVTSITPFGLAGPWSNRPATEFTLQAWSGGIVGLGRGSTDRPPVFVGGQVGEWLTGVYAAIGTMVARVRALRDGPGELVDVSMLETLVLCLTYHPVTYADMVGRPFRSGRSIVTPGVEATSDGFVGVGVGTGQQWLDFCVMVGHPEWMEDRSLFAGRAHLQPEVAAWMAEHTTAEVLELAAAFRIPHAPIGNGATIPATDHFRARGSIVQNCRNGFDEPDRPYRFDPPLLRAPEPAPRLGDHARGRPDLRAAGEPVVADPAAGQLPFHGLRVLDLTAFWAGPLCTHLLAMLGADVLHIESTARPDGTRLLSGVRVSEPDWWEQSGIFAGLNTNKRSVTLDLASDRGRELLRRLLATCDVIVENYTPRVLEQMGLDIDAVRAIRPDVVIVRMPGFGLDGPWRDDPAFAFVIEDAAGLTWMTGHPDQNPVSPYCVGDSNAGVHALCGLLLALEHRRRCGEGVLLEAAMVDAALNVAAEQVVELSAYGALLERDGNRGPTAAPQNLYLAADTDADGMRDAWVAIAVASDDQWLGLCDALGRPAWATDPTLTTAAGRHKAHDAIDLHLSSWCDGRRAEEIVECLWAAGVPVAKVMQPHDQATLPPLQFRGFFEEVERAVTGAARHSTLPIRFSRGPDRFHRRPAPLLGEHNHEVLRDLGVSDDELAALDDQGVIGRAPDAARRSGPRS